MSKHAAGDGDRPRYTDPPTTPRRKRVVLADSRAPVTVLRTVIELEEQTSWAEEVVRDFIRTQFRVAFAFAVTGFALFLSLPVLFYYIPELSEITVAGVRLPWLMLGIAPFPLLFGIGYWYNSVAERNELAFVDMVEK